MSDSDPHRMRTEGLTADQIVDSIRYHQGRIRASEMYRDGQIEHAHFLHSQHVAVHNAAITALLAAEPIKENR